MEKTNGNGNTTLTGKVLRTNDRGLVLEGQRGWLNISKFATGVTIPAVGALVQVTLDRAGFIRAIEPAEVEWERVERWADTELPEPPHAEAAPAATTQSEPSAGTPPDRDRVITRQWAVNAAATILSSGGRAVSPDDALALAARLEAWALRPV